MAELIGTSDPKVISSMKQTKKEEFLIEYEVTVSGTLQKQVYDRLLDLKIKDVELKGFRKGEAPRTMVEPQVYSEVTEAMANTLINAAVEELLETEKIMTITLPDVTNVAFTMVESPLAFTVKIQPIGNYNLPDMSKNQIVVGDQEVTEKEIIDTIERMWQDWVKKATDEDKAQFTEVTEEWIEKKLNLPNVKSKAELEKVIKEELAHIKVHESEDKQIGGLLEKTTETMGIKVPPDFLEKNVEASIKSQKERIAKYGMTWETFLQSYKVTEEEFKKDLEESLSRQYKEDIFWTLYVKDRNIQIDTKSKDDAVFINYAASNMGVKPEQQLDQQTINRILRTAALYKALRELRKEVGLADHDHDSHDHSHEVEAMDAVAKEN